MIMIAGIALHLKKLYGCFYGWGSTASRLEPLRGGSLLFTTKFPEIPGAHFIALERMKDSADFGATRAVFNTGPLDWESSALTTRLLLHKHGSRLVRAKPG